MGYQGTSGEPPVAVVTGLGAERPRPSSFGIPVWCLLVGIPARLLVSQHEGVCGELAWQMTALTLGRRSKPAKGEATYNGPPNSSIFNPSAGSAGEIRSQQRGGRGTREFNGDLPRIRRRVLDSHKISVENPVERVTRQVLQARVDHDQVSILSPG